MAPVDNLLNFTVFLFVFYKTSKRLGKQQSNESF